MTDPNTLALRLNTDELFLQVWKYMSFFSRKLQRNLKSKFWKSYVLASLTLSDRVSLLSVQIWQQCYWQINQICKSNFVAIILGSSIRFAFKMKQYAKNQIYRARVPFD